MLINKKTRLQYRLNSIVFLLLFLSSVFILAWLSHHYNIRSDWTANQRNSLSKDTIKLLGTLDKKIIIRSYQNINDGSQAAVTEILLNYQRHKKDFIFKVLNPDLDITLAKADNIVAYGQTVIKYNDKQETINNLSEDEVSNALLRLSRTKRPLLGFVNNHGERNIAAKNSVGYNKFAEQLRSKGFQLQTINLLSQNIGPEIDTLIIAGSEKKWLEGEVSKLISFINGGGNLLWLRDPGEALLQKLAAALELSFLNGIVVDNDVSLRKTLGIQHPAVIPIIQYGDHAINEDMRYNTLFPIANAVKINTDTQWQAAALLITLKSSWSETAGLGLDVDFDETKGDVQGPLNLAFALEREINSKHQRIVVIGDSDFLANSYLGAGANMLFGMNSINWLSQSDQLISIAPKNARDLKLQLSDNQILFISFAFLIIIPLMLLLSGVMVWRKRRNQ